MKYSSQIQCLPCWSPSGHAQRQKDASLEWVHPVCSLHILVKEENWTLPGQTSLKVDPLSQRMRSADLKSDLREMLKIIIKSNIVKSRVKPPCLEQVLYHGLLILSSPPQVFMVTPPICQEDHLYWIILKPRPKCVLVCDKLIRLTFTHLAQPVLLRFPLGAASLRPVDRTESLALPDGFPDVWRWCGLRELDKPSNRLPMTKGGCASSGLEWPFTWFLAYKKNVVENITKKKRGRYCSTKYTG